MSNFKDPRLFNGAYRGELMNLLKRYISQGAPKPDPRKHPNGRKPLKTDAGSGKQYFFGDNNERIEYNAFDFDHSTTRATYNRMVSLGILDGSESFDVLHARAMNKYDLSGLRRNNKR